MQVSKVDFSFDHSFFKNKLKIDVSDLSTNKLALTLLQKLDLTEVYFENSCLKFIGENCKSLTEVDLSGSIGFNFLGLESLAPALKLVNKLTLSRIKFFNKGTPAGKKTYEKVVKALKDNCGKLLRFEGKQFNDDDATILLPALFAVKQLCFQDITLTDEKKKFVKTLVKSCQKLEELEVIPKGDLKVIPKGDLTPCMNELIPALKNVKFLNLAGGLINPSKENGFNPRNFVSKCKNLKKVNFSKCVLSDAFLTGIAPAFTNIEELYLGTLNSRDHEGLAVIGKQCKKLQKLSIDSAPISYSQFKVLSDLLSKLTSLNVQSLKKDHHHFDHLFKPSENLKTLELAKCELNDDDLKSLVPSLKKLETLDLSGNKITSVSLSLIAEHCKSLKKLSLKECFLRDDDLTSLPSLFPHLEELYLDGNPKLTEKTLFELGAHCKKLKLLSLESCQLNDQDVSALSLALRHLEVLNLNDNPITGSCFGDLSLYCQKLRKMHLFKCHQLMGENLFKLESILKHLNALSLPNIKAEILVEILKISADLCLFEIDTKLYETKYQVKQLLDRISKDIQVQQPSKKRKTSLKIDG